MTDPAPLDRARELLARLSTDDRVAIALGEFDRVAEPDVVPLVYVDGPNGVRSADGATAFPSTLALAASFDRALAAEYGGAVAAEVLADGKNVLLGPALDIARVPVAGRLGESLGEDPVLAGEIGGAVVAALHREGVLAVLKHYVANNAEWLRTGSGVVDRGPAADVAIDDRTLVDLYLEPFRRAVVHHGAAALMSSYNRIGGEYVSQRADLLALPREEWGFTGLTVPDFLFAVRDPRAALSAGLDLPGLDGASGRTADDLLADPDRLDAAVLHVLTAIESVGLARPHDDRARLGLPAARDLAERIAVEGMTLLRNGAGVLPLPAGASVAVIDAATADDLLVIGGSASVRVPRGRVRSLADALRGQPGAGTVTDLRATDGERPGAPLEAEVVAVVRHADGEPEERHLDRFALAAEAPGAWTATVTATLTPTVTGEHLFTLEFAGRCELLIDGAVVAHGFREASPFVEGPPYPLHAVVELEAGRRVDVRVEYDTSVAIAVPIPGRPIAPHLALAWSEPDDRIRQAAEAAASSDVAVVVVGRISGEGMDVEDLRLPGRQEALIRAIAARAPQTVVVTLGAGPVVMPWLDDVDAVLHAWFPGEGFAEAAARVLTGEAEPGGRLPISWPATSGSGPLTTAEQYPGVDGRVEYSEGSLVGYRWWLAEGRQPAFPFGHGLGYTTFGLTDVAAAVEGADVVVRCTVRNTGARPGKAVPQVFVAFPEAAAQPPLQLMGFTALRLDPGEAGDLEVRIAVDDLARADEDGRRRVVPGRYDVRVGWSAADPGVTAAVTL